SEKLASLGQLAAGISHEINNPVAFVSNNLVVLQQEFQAALELLERYQAQRDRLAQVEPAAAAELARQEEEIDIAYTQQNVGRQFQSSLNGLRRVQDIVRNLCDFARLDRAEWQEVDLNTYLRSTIEILSFELKRKSIELQTQFEELTPV